MKIKIIGAGSAGNHMAYAFTTFKETRKIVLSDINTKALKRSKKEIFLKRYRKWDKRISLEIEKENLNKNEKYDAIIISSPPATHKISIKKNIEKSDIFLIEKPLCAPNKKEIEFFKKLKTKYKKKVFLCGYNHRLFPSTKYLNEKLKKEKIIFCNVLFKENISGFLKAHNWMKSINETYLSKTKLGGGALCEHSHALNLTQYFLNEGNYKIINKHSKFNKDSNNFHDTSFHAYLKIDGILCEFEQNFETHPVEKKILIITKSKIFTLIFNYKRTNDLLIINDFKNLKKITFNKDRKDDFIYEAKYIIQIINKDYKDKSLDISHGIKTMEIIYKLLNTK